SRPGRKTSPITPLSVQTRIATTTVVAILIAPAWAPYSCKSRANPPRCLYRRARASGPRLSKFMDRVE
ncbi:MAG: hypothetical protein ACFFD2_25875, partial [Promethearchaeota archaeon]